MSNVQSSAAVREVIWDDALTRRGISVIPCTPQSGTAYWKVVRGEYWREKEHTFVELLDQGGKRMAGIKVRFWWGQGARPDEQEIKTAELKPERWMIDFPMFNAGKSYGVEVLGLPSEKVWGLGLGSPEHPDYKEHVSWKLTFQLTTAAETVTEDQGGPEGMPVVFLRQRPAAPAPEENSRRLPLWLDGTGSLCVQLPDGTVRKIPILLSEEP